MSLNPNTKLSEYATTGKRCLETPEKCVLVETTSPTPGVSPELDKFIAAPYGDGLSNAVRKDLEQKHLETIKNEINNNKELDDYQFQKLNNYSNQKSQTNTNEATSKKPTNDEIVAALKVLNDAGLNSYAQMPNYQNLQMPQIDMLNQPNGNNATLNMLPLMFAQNKDGTSNYSPQLMQAVMMNSMMPNFDFNFDLDKNKND